MKKIIFLSLIIFCRFVVNAQQVNTLRLMPTPKEVVQKAGEFRVTNKFTISVQANATDTILYKAVNRTYQALNRKTGLAFGQQYITPLDTSGSASLLLVVKAAVNAGIGMNESYALIVGEKQIVLNASNTIGALHGLQTLMQLVDKNDNGYFFPCVTINDSPRFKWRGLMIDAARHFISFEEMKKNIDAMDAVKMNVLHWHLSDDEGFRVESKLFPKLQADGSNGD
jgi:hexosaminidase